MKCAALILASRSPAGVNALSTYFRSVDIDVFIHVDRKIKQQEFGSSAPSSFFVEERVEIYWRGFTMVEAMVTLLKHATSTDRYQRFLFVSDDSLPLIASEQLLDALHPNLDFLNIADINSPDFRWRYDNFYMLDSAATQIRWRAIREKVIDQNFLSRLEPLKELLKRGKKPLEKYCRGSQWMCLTEASVQLILKTYEEDEWLRQSFAFSEVPDEAYFHSIVGDSRPRNLRTYMYTDWSAPTPPRIFHHPSELEMALASGAIFARKVEFPTNEYVEWIKNLTIASKR